MELNKTLWHARLYLACHFLWRSFWTSQDVIETPLQTNLCHYMRSIVAGIIVAAIYLAMSTAVIYVLLWHPIAEFGRHYLYFWLVIAAAVTFIVVCVFLFIGGKRAVGWMADTITDAVDYVANERERKAKERLAAGRPSFLQLIGAYLKALKEGICPLITLSEGKRSEGGAQ